MSSIRFRLREVFGVDLRSLAVLRIGLGLSVLLTVASYAPDWRDLLGDEGVISRGAAYAAAGPEVAPYFAPFWLAPGLMEWLLPAALGGFGLALTLGFHSRLACAACWYFIYCLQVRNPFVGDYSDDVVLRLLFWGIFLPLGARFALDARARSALDARAPGARAAPANPVVSIASAGLLIQIASVYFVAGFMKTGAAWQLDLTAVQHTVEGHFRGTPYAAWLLGYPQLLTLATWLTPRFEVLIGLVIFVPYATALVRTLAVALLVGFHLSLALCINLGAAPFVSCVAALALLPGACWDRRLWPPRAAAAREPYPTPAAAPASARWKLAGEALLAIPLFVMLAFDALEIAGAKQHRGVALQWLGETLRLTQQWDMFSPAPAPFDGWFRAPGVLANGEVVDLLREGAPDRGEPPASVPWMGDDYRMGNFREAVRNRIRTLGDEYGAWLCRSWNREHTGGERLERFEYAWMHVDFSSGTRSEPRRTWLIRKRCDPQPASSGP